ncbi:MAG: tyrosine-type recombinase/integrase [Candidatus Thiodiazotropha taylori]
MASKIDTLTKRRKLAPRTWPYWERIVKGQFIGFYRSPNGGTWHARISINRSQDYEKLGGEIDSEYEEMLKHALAWFKMKSLVKDTSYTVQQAVDDYVSHLRVENGEKSSKAVKQRLHKHLIPKFKKNELGKLTPAQIKRWRDGLVRISENEEDVRRSKDNANRILSVAKAAFNLAYRNGLVDSDRAWKIVQSFRDVGDSRKLFLTDKQINSLLTHTKGGFHNLIKAAVLTGARYGELASVKVRDFDKAHGTLRLEGKTGKRDGYLSDEAIAFLKEICKERLPDAYLLVRDDGMPWGKSHQHRPMKEAVKAAKVPKETVFYSIRHYHISKALLAGIPAQVIAENCGTSIRMLEKHYGKFMATDRRRMMNQVKLG